MSGPLDFGLVDELVAALVAAGVSAAVDESELNLPGVWVRVSAVRVDVLSGAPTIGVRLILMVPDTDPERSLTALQDLWNKVVAVADPDGDSLAATITRPSDNSAVPALIVPLDLLP